MKDKQKAMRKALNVISCCILFYCISCSSFKKKQIEIPKTYSIKKFKSKTLFTGVVIKAYDDINTEISFPVTSIINNVYLEGASFSLGLGKHKIKLIYPSKKDVLINNLKVKPRDSIVIKAYLIDDDSDIY